MKRLLCVVWFIYASSLTAWAQAPAAWGIDVQAYGPGTPPMFTIRRVSTGPNRYRVSHSPGVNAGASTTVEIAFGNGTWSDGQVYDTQWHFPSDNGVSKTVTIAPSYPVIFQTGSYYSPAFNGPMMSVDCNSSCMSAYANMCATISGEVVPCPGGGGDIDDEPGGPGGGGGSMCECIADGIGDAGDSIVEGIKEALLDLFIPDPAKITELKTHTGQLTTWGPFSTVRELAALSELEAADGHFTLGVPEMRWMQKEPPVLDDEGNPLPCPDGCDWKEAVVHPITFDAWTATPGWSLLRSAMGMFIYVTLIVYIWKVLTPHLQV